MPGSSNIDAPSILGRRTAFSLVEMLAVMAIIVLLLAATLPAMRGLNQSESRRGAVGNLMGVLDRARMMAISDGLATYIVFASKTSTTPQINANLWGHAYAIYQDSDNISFTPVQKTPWMQLPKGIAIKAPITTSGSAYPSVIDRPLTSGKDPAFKVTGFATPNGTNGSTNVQLPYWKFDGVGVLDEATFPAGVDPTPYRRVLLFPGFIDANGNEIPTQNNGSTTGNKQPLQLEEVRVEPATGRAKYIIDPTNNLSTPSSTPQP